jgi:hypothetical protein
MLHNVVCVWCDMIISQKICTLPLCVYIRGSFPHKDYKNRTYSFSPLLQYKREEVSSSSNNSDSCFTMCMVPIYART